MLYIKVKKNIRNKKGVSFLRYSCFYNKGFTLLEMLITFAIIGVLALAAASYNVVSSQAKKSFINTYKTLQEQLDNLRYEALARSTTTRMVVTEGTGDFTITSYYSSTATTSCSSAGSWTVLSTRTVDISNKYGISGTGMSNSCFYRDGSSSGGDFVIAPAVAGDGLKTATITLTIATGYLDVVVEE